MPSWETSRVPAKGSLEPPGRQGDVAIVGNAELSKSARKRVVRYTSWLTLENHV